MEAYARTVDKQSRGSKAALVIEFWPSGLNSAASSRAVMVYLNLMLWHIRNYHRAIDLAGLLALDQAVTGFGIQFRLTCPAKHLTCTVST